MVRATLLSGTADTVDALEGLLSWGRRHRTDTVLSATAFTTLDRLSYAGPARISDLAVSEHVSQPAMTALVNRLAAEGLAVRAADPSDGRAALVSVTATGQRAVAAHRTARVQALAPALDALTEADRDLLAAAAPAIRRLIAGDSFITADSSRESAHA